MATIDGGNINIGDHGDKLLSKLYDLYYSGMFLDLNLSFKGGYISAHKAVLAAASPYFLEKLSQLKDRQIKIDLEHDLKDLSVDVEDLRLLVEFIYKGQVHVPQIKLQDFLNLGVHLQVLGLCKDPEIDCDKSDFPDALANFPLQANILSPFLSHEQMYEAISGDETIHCFDVDPHDVLTNPGKPSCSNIKPDNSFSNHFNSCSDGSTLLERQAGDDQCKVGSTCGEFEGEKVCDIFYFGGEGIQPSVYLNGSEYDSAYNTQEIHVIAENDKCLFDEATSAPGHDMLMSSCEPAQLLQHNEFNDDTSLENLLVHACKVVDDDHSLLPERQCSQARLKVKDSIGGVSLQDTSQGDKNSSYVKLLALEEDVKTIEGITSESQYGFNQDSNSLGEINKAVVSPTPKDPPKNGCSKCEKQFDDIEVLTQHLWDEHSLGTFHKCVLCDFKALSENLLVKHGKIHFDSLQKMCCVCSKVFKTKATLKNHMSSHCSERWFQCTHCNNHYTQRHNLVKHMASEHHMNENGTAIMAKMRCDQCSYVSFALHKLNQHKIRSHTTNKRHKCDRCDYSTTEKTTLSKHIRTHTHERPYICDTCGLSFVTVSSLKRHSRTHTKVKPYICDKCGKVYADKKRLRDHYLKHSSMKPFRCKLCDYSTVRNDNLKSHVSRSHAANAKCVTSSTDKKGIVLVAET